MSQIKLAPNASGTGIFTIDSPNSNTNRTLTLPDATGTIITTAGGAAISGTTGTFTGLVDISAAGAGQIQFPATQNASSNANTLDDYEEGDWTPTDASGAGLTLTVNGAQYVKIGRMVYGWLWITYPSTANGNYAEVGGLPFAVAGGNTNGGAFVGYTTYATAGFSGYLIYTTTKISFAIPNGAPSNANLSGKEMRMQFFYVV